MRLLAAAVVWLAAIPAVAGEPVLTSTTLTAHEGPLVALAFSPDGKALASTGEDAAVRIWSRPERRLLRKLSDPETPSTPGGVAFSTTGMRLAVRFGLGRIVVWRVVDGEVEQRIDLPDLAASSPGDAMSFASDGDHLAIADRYGGAWIVHTNAAIKDPPGWFPGDDSEGDTSVLAFTVHGDLFAAGRRGAFFFDPSRGRRAATLALGDDPGRAAVVDACITSDLESIVGLVAPTATAIHLELHAWSSLTGKLVARRALPEASFVGIASLPLRRLVLVTVDGDEVALWTGSFEQVLRGGHATLGRLPPRPPIAFSRDGKTVAVGTLDGTIHLLEVPE
jgi:WD40 repeat protein